MYLVFVDDAKQRRPSRAGFKGELVAAGAVLVPADHARRTEMALAELCVAHGFPPDEEFKWSPRRNTWMYDNLVEDARREFLLGVIRCLKEGGALALVVMEDSGRGSAIGRLSTEEDVIALLFERIANRLKEFRETGLVIADRPGGDRREEDQFVLQCLEKLETGTAYVSHDELTFVLTTDSRFVRLLQATDVIASSLAAFVAGEAVYSPPIVADALPLFPEAYDRRAGVSIKVHPDFVFANLHHWLFGESHFVRFQTGHPMPMKGFPYFTSPDEF